MKNKLIYALTDIVNEAFSDTGSFQNVIMPERTKSIGDYT